MRLNIPSYERNCIMLSVAAARASSRTGVNVTKCHIFWHNRKIEFITKLANDVSFSKEACDTLSHIKGDDFNCMYLNIVDSTQSLYYKSVINRIIIMQLKFYSRL